MKLLFKTSIVLILLINLLFSQGCIIPGSNGNGGGTSQMDSCKVLASEADSTQFTFENLSLRYNLDSLNFTEGDRLELQMAHNGFETMQGALTSLFYILCNEAQYPSSRKPEIKTALFWESRCLGSIEKTFSQFEVGDKTIQNLPSIGVGLSRVSFSIKTIRVSISNKQILWEGDVRNLQTYFGSFVENGQLAPISVSVSGISNSTTGHGSFAGYALDGDEGPIEVFENTVDSDFADCITDVIVNGQAFSFSSTLSKSIYIHGAFDSTLRWRRPTIYDFYVEDEGEEEGVEGGE